MNTDINVKAPIFRYGNEVVNLNYMVRANIYYGNVTMSDGRIVSVPKEVLECWFSSYFDYAKPKKLDINSLLR